MDGFFGGLWRHHDFLKLWAGESVSHVGTQVTQLALPLTAAITLQASPADMGFLAAAEFAPFLLIGLFAGVWVDRLPRRPILIGADLGRAVVLATIPAAALLGVLRMEQLYVVAVVTGTLTVFFDVAYQSFLPALVGREELVEGNSKLEVSRSVAQIAGPGLAGGLVQLVTAPVAIALDAASFVWSAGFLAAIRGADLPVPPKSERRSIWLEIGEGLQVVLGNRLLRSIAGCTATSNLFGNMAWAVLVLYATRDLAMSPALLGLTYAAGAVGGLIGAVAASRVAYQFGLGPTIVVSALLSSVGGLIIPFASGPLPTAVAILILAQAIYGVSNPIYNVNQVSLRQAITPDRLQGRMNASMRFVVWGTIPIGSLIGGGLGEWIGVRETLFVGGIGGLLAFLWVLFSPVRTLKKQPQPVGA